MASFITSERRKAAVAKEQSACPPARRMTIWVADCLNGTGRGFGAGYGAAAKALPPLGGGLSWASGTPVSMSRFAAIETGGAGL